MRDINQYQSKIKSEGEREVLVIDGDEALVEHNGVYSIRSFQKVGQARVKFYRGIDEKNDPESVLNAIREGK